MNERYDKPESRVLAEYGAGWLVATATTTALVLPVCAHYGDESWQGFAVFGVCLVAWVAWLAWWMPRQP